MHAMLIHVRPRMTPLFGTDVRLPDLKKKPSKAWDGRDCLRFTPRDDEYGSPLNAEATPKLARL